MYFTGNQQKNQIGCSVGAKFGSNYVNVVKKVRDCQQITFVTLNGFCPLSKKNPTPPVLNGQYQNR